MAKQLVAIYDVKLKKSHPNIEKFFEENNFSKNLRGIARQLIENKIDAAHAHKIHDPALLANITLSEITADSLKKSLNVMQTEKAQQQFIQLTKDKFKQPA